MAPSIAWRSHPLWKIRGVKRCLLVQTFSLGLASCILSCAGADAGSSLRHRDRLLGSSIKHLMTRYGLPARVSKLEHNKTAYHWQLKAAMVFDDSGVSRTEEFQCEVTAITSPRGTVIKLLTDVPNAGAGVLAAVGAFGTLCEKSFGMKSSRRHS
jgi:hypothetical protein